MAKTPVFDWEKGEFKIDLQGQVVTATEGEAVGQIVLKAQQTTRGLFLIYADPEDPALHHKYGNDSRWVLIEELTEAARISELERAAREALIYDPWITDVRDIKVTRQNYKEKDGQEYPAYELTAEVVHIYGVDQIEGRVTDGN